jgi:hypothetical protein
VLLLPPTQVESPLILRPYVQWQPRPVPDPHSASLPELIDVLLEIVNAEGPIVCRRVYSLYNKASGSARLGKQIVHVLNRVCVVRTELWRPATLRIGVLQSRGYGCASFYAAPALEVDRRVASLCRHRKHGGADLGKPISREVSPRSRPSSRVAGPDRCAPLFPTTIVAR